MTEMDTANNGEQRFKTDDADSYNAVVDYFDEYTERFTSHMPGPLMELANMPANSSVLDIGTGTGIIAIAVADKLTEGKVAGIDLSDGMLAMAAEKAKLKGLAERCEFIKMDAEQLAFPDNYFDAAISLYALRHFPNPDRSVNEIYRVLKPGARIVVAVGSPPSLLSTDGIKAVIRRVSSAIRKAGGRELQACEFIDSLVEKYIPERKDRDVAEWVKHHHGFTGSIRDLVINSGFEKVSTCWKGQYSVISSPDDFWLLQMTFSSIARKRTQSANISEIEQLREEFFRRCDEVLQKNGRLVYQSGAAIIAGTKPG